MSAFISQAEKVALRSTSPIDIDQLKYSQVNRDENPIIIRKKSKQIVQYIQQLAIRYLQPPPLPPSSDIYIIQEPDVATQPAPPLIIRQQAARPKTPLPLLIREKPPSAPRELATKRILISGKRLPPPPRKLIIEKLPAQPSKPQPVLIERWLPYPQIKRKVILNRLNIPDPVVLRPRNVIVQWEPPNVKINTVFKYLGVKIYLKKIKFMFNLN